MTFCAWCGKDVKNRPKTHIWVDNDLMIIRTYKGTRIPFCSDECKDQWKDTKWIDHCIVCGKKIKSEAPGNKKITRNDITFYACPHHKDRDEEIDSLIEIALEDIGDALDDIGDEQIVLPPIMTVKEVAEAAIAGAGYDEEIRELKEAIFDIMKNGVKCLTDEKATLEQYDYFVKKVINEIVEIA